MTTWSKRRCAVGLPVLFAVTLFSAAAPAADPTFKAFVNQLETNYRLKRAHIPLMWLVKGVVRVAQPAGVSRLDIAVFDNQDMRRLRADTDFPERVHKLVDPSWQPFVEAHSLKSGEHALLYIRQKGKDVEMLILGVENNEAAVVLTRLNPQRLQELADNPASAYRHHAR
jgi:hypothetical protein